MKCELFEYELGASAVVVSVILVDLEHIQLVLVNLTSSCRVYGTWYIWFPSGILE